VDVTKPKTSAKISVFRPYPPLLLPALFKTISEDCFNIIWALNSAQPVHESRAYHRIDLLGPVFIALSLTFTEKISSDWAHDLTAILVPWF